MKISKKRLQQIIKEELENVLMEQEPVRDIPVPADLSTPQGIWESLSPYHGSVLKPFTTERTEDDENKRTPGFNSWFECAEGLSAMARAAHEGWIQLVKYFPNVDVDCYEGKLARDKDIKLAKKIENKMNGLYKSEKVAKRVIVTNANKYISLLKSLVKEHAGSWENVPKFDKFKQMIESCSADGDDL